MLCLQKLKINMEENWKYIFERIAALAKEQEEIRKRIEKLENADKKYN